MSMPFTKLKTMEEARIDKIVSAEKKKGLIIGLGVGFALGIFAYLAWFLILSFVGDGLCK